MSKIFKYLLVFFSLISLGNCTSKKTGEDTPTPAVVQEEIKRPLHLVFVTGDEEYRSEESMPMLADILQRELNCKISICYSLDEEGFVDPNNTKHISGLEALDSADLMIMFTRFRELPDEELKYIAAYAESGRPMVGFRTSTHSFLYKTNKEREFYNDEWPTKVFGQKWITHHGHFNDGSSPLTKVEILDSKRQHPILRGVNNFDAFSWLYHVEGGNDKLAGDSDPLLLGTSLQSTHQANGNLDKYPLTNPVAWTKSYTGLHEISCRVFFTTLGHPFDFKETSMRKLALNGIYWALGLEEQIPPDGVNAAFVSEYEPNESGMGDHYKKQLKPRTY